MLLPDHSGRLSRDEIESLFGRIDLLDLQRIGKLRFQIGEEFGVYCRSFIDKAPEATDEILMPMFFNRERYLEESSVFNFLESKNQHHAAGMYLPLNIVSMKFPSPSDGRIFAGKAGNRASLHFDWSLGKNIVFNLMGKKTFRLYSPERTRELCGYGNLALPLPGTIEPDHIITISEGEGVYFDPFWWHEVVYDTNSISISVRVSPEEHLPAFHKTPYPSWKFIEAWQKLGPLALNLIDPQVENWEQNLKPFSQNTPDHKFYLPWAQAYVRYRKMTESYEFRYEG